MQGSGAFFQKGGLTFRHYINDNPRPAIYAMHTHKEFELIYVLSGEVSRVIEGRKYKLAVGDMVLIRPSQYHFGQMDACSRYERYNIWIDESMVRLDSIAFFPKDVEVVNLSSNPIAMDLFRKMDYYHEHASEDVFLQICPLLLNELFYNLSLVSHPAPHDVTIISPLLSQALQYISENLFTLTGIQEIADTLYVSESYLFRLFRTILHQSPKKYIADKRLLAAQQRISMGGKPTLVARECGFLDYSAFYRNYTAFFGYPPSQEPPTPQPKDRP